MTHHIKHVLSLLILCILVISSCSLSKKKSTEDCNLLKGCDQFHCLFPKCWCVQDGTAVVFDSKLEVVDEKDVILVMEKYYSIMGDIIPLLDHISTLGHGWYNVFYKNDVTFTIGPKGKIYNTTCGV